MTVLPVSPYPTTQSDVLSLSTDIASKPMSTQEDLLQQRTMTSRHSRQINFGYPPERHQSYWNDEVEFETRRRRLGRKLSVRNYWRPQRPSFDCSGEEQKFAKTVRRKLKKLAEKVAG